MTKQEAQEEIERLQRRIGELTQIAQSDCCQYQPWARAGNPIACACRYRYMSSNGCNGSSSQQGKTR